MFAASLHTLRNIFKVSSVKTIDAAYRYYAENDLEYDFKKKIRKIKAEIWKITSFVLFLCSISIHAQTSRPEWILPGQQSQNDRRHGPSIREEGPGVDGKASYSGAGKDPL